jgi:hypothetical protein
VRLPDTHRKSRSGLLQGARKGNGDSAFGSAEIDNCQRISEVLMRLPPPPGGAVANARTPMEGQWKDRLSAGTSRES